MGARTSTPTKAAIAGVVGVIAIAGGVVLVTVPALAVGWKKVAGVVTAAGGLTALISGRMAVMDAPKNDPTFQRLKANSPYAYSPQLKQAGRIVIEQAQPNAPAANPIYTQVTKEEY